MNLSKKQTHLQNNVDKDDKKRISQVEEEPHLDRFDSVGAWERGGHRQVDGGQHHHTSDVHSDDQVIL